MFASKALNEKYVIPRHEGWEEILEPLVRRITGAQQGKCRTACNHTNDTFTIKMHHMGLCPCEYGQKRKEFEENNKHASECFHPNWKEIDDAFRSHPKYSQALILKTERINMEMQLCRKYRLPYQGGSYIENLCTCNFERKWAVLDIEHAEDCPVITPNFYHPASGTKVYWNKKFFRDSYSNRRLSSEEFQNIISECIKSI